MPQTRTLNALSRNLLQKSRSRLERQEVLLAATITKELWLLILPLKIRAMGLPRPVVLPFRNNQRVSCRIMQLNIKQRTRL